MKAPLYLFGWPSALGGSETKLAATAGLLAGDFAITWVPNDAGVLGERRTRAWLVRHGMAAAAWEELPRRLQGTGLALCNIRFLTEGRALEARMRGLRLVWGNEMMWPLPAELAALTAGVLDTVLYTGGVQRADLEPRYAEVLGAVVPPRGPGEQEPHAAWGGTGGMLSGVRGSVRWATVGNFVNAEEWPWRDRTRRRRWPELVIGRLSRADWGKFPGDFPRSYDRLRLEGAVRRRVMAWSPAMKQLWPGYGWGREWELLPALAEEPQRFLQSLDLFVYDVHRNFRESWGRAVVEAMLTGAVPLIPADPRHHLPHLVPHGVAGFHCARAADWRRWAQALQGDATLRRTMSRAAGEYARDGLCDPTRHREVWRTVLGG